MKKNNTTILMAFLMTTTFFVPKVQAGIFDNISGVFSSLTSGVKQAASSAFSSLKNVASEGLNTLTSGQGLQGLMNNVTGSNGGKGFGNMVSELTSKVGSAANQGLGSLFSIGSNTLDKVTGFLPAQYQQAAQGYLGTGLSQLQNKTQGFMDQFQNRAPGLLQNYANKGMGQLQNYANQGINYLDRGMGQLQNYANQASKYVPALGNLGQSLTSQNLMNKLQGATGLNLSNLSSSFGGFNKGNTQGTDV